MKAWAEWYITQRWQWRAWMHSLITVVFLVLWPSIIRTEGLWGVLVGGGFLVINTLLLFIACGGGRPYLRRRRD